jgi:hypothetical protein
MEGNKTLGEGAPYMTLDLPLNCINVVDSPSKVRLGCLAVKQHNLAIINGFIKIAVR